MSEWLCMTYPSGGNIATVTGVSGSAWHYPKDPHTAFLCESVSQTIAVDVTQCFFPYVYAVLYSLSQPDYLLFSYRATAAGMW